MLDNFHNINFYIKIYSKDKMYKYNLMCMMRIEMDSPYNILLHKLQQPKSHILCFHKLIKGSFLNKFHFFHNILMAEGIFTNIYLNLKQNSIHTCNLYTYQLFRYMTNNLSCKLYIFLQQVHNQKDKCLYINWW